MSRHQLPAILITIAILAIQAAMVITAWRILNSSTHL